MKINPNVVNAQQKLDKQNVKKAEQEVKPVKTPEVGVEYLPSNKGEDKKITYEKPETTKVDQKLIADLKRASEEKYQNLRNLVKEMLARQGMTFKDVLDGKAIEVDEITQSQAQAAISEGGDQSPEAVSDRIVEFAKAISGGDKSKFNLLVGAIDEGFSEARRLLGGQLPEISQKTYDLVMEKIENWKNEE